MPVDKQVPSRPMPESGTLDVEAIIRGDRAAFEALVAQESPRLFRVLLRILRDEDEARSVLQETFLQAFLRLKTFQGHARLTTWVYAIGINLAHGALRKSGRVNVMEERDIEQLQPAFRRGMYVERYMPWDPEHLAESAERQRVVRAAIDRLPDGYREVVLLRDMEEFSSAEVARMLDMTEGAVRVRLHRGRQALRTLLDSYFGKGE